MNIPYLLTAFSAAALSAGVAVYLTRKSVLAVGTTVAILLGAASVWLLSVGLHELSSDIETKVLFTKFQYLGTVIVPPAMLVAALQYSGRGYLVTARNVTLLMIVPLFTLIMVWTFPQHDLYWKEVVWRTQEEGTLDYRRGPLFWFWIAYAYTSLLVGTALLLNYLHETPSVFQGQYFVLFIAIISPWLANVAYLLDLTPWPGTDTTAFGFVLTGLALGWGIMRLQMSNVIPLAHRSILESMTEAIFVLDSQGQLVDLNPAAQQTVSNYMATAPESLIGESYGNVFSVFPTLNEEVRKSIGQSSYQRNTEINLGDDTTVDIQNLRLSPVTDPRGDFLGTLIELRDVNSLKQAEADRLSLESELRHARKLESLGVMAGGIAHDFNNLLTGISGHAELAERKLDGESPAAPHLKQVRDISSLAAELCEQLLAYSGKGQFDIRVLDINEIIQDVLSLLEIKNPGSAKVTCSLDDTLPMVKADATQIQQLLMNLAINASEALGGEPGEITISTMCGLFGSKQFAELDVGADLPAGSYVMVTVSDSGSGMDAATLERIFDPFFTTKFTGRGLGLSAALGIIQGHQGGLKILSEPGRGTTFQIFLPASEEQKPARAPTAFSDVSSASPGGKILVIDDESFVRDVLVESLEHLGFETLISTNGLDGISTFETHQNEIVAVLLDLSMPEMDGQACYERLKQLNPQISVIIMSGFHEKEVSHRFDDQDRLRFLQKPFKIDQLLEAIAAVV